MLKTFSEIEQFGFAFNKNECLKLMDKIGSQLLVQKARIFSEAKEQFDLDSDDELAEILFTKLQLTSRKGSAGVGATVLTEMKHPICAAIVRWRKLCSASQALQILSNSCDKCVDGRIRARFEAPSASNGTLLWSAPEMTALSQLDQHLRRCDPRSVLVAPKGFVLVLSQFCMLELRTLCQLSSDRKLEKILDSSDGLDPLQKMAEQLSTKSMPVSRKMAAQLCSGITQAMGAERLAVEVNCSVSNAHLLINRFFRLFPKSKRWMLSKIRESQETLCAKSILGRCKDLAAFLQNDDPKEFGRQAINHIIQSSVADVFIGGSFMLQKGFKTLEFERVGSSERVVIEEIRVSARIVAVFDGKIFVTVPQESVQQTAQIMRKSLEKAFDLTLKYGEEARLRFPIKIWQGRAGKVFQSSTSMTSSFRLEIPSHLLGCGQGLEQDSQQYFLLFKGQKLDAELSLGYYEIGQTVYWLGQTDSEQTVSVTCHHSTHYLRGL
uniref:DNA-directed DNA polymerase family A palm domain-containing protein n=1 Tax=Ditylenchus dipsaci TaxID=166011 RepID=A0A915CXB1_9BILA